MAKFLIKRISSLLVVLFGVTVITFALTALISGNPAEIVLLRTGIYPTLEEIAQMEARMGFDVSLPRQYILWLANALRLDFGMSFITRRPVVVELALRLPATIWLAGGAFALMVMLALLGGLVSVYFDGRTVDKLVSAFTVVFMGVPGFVLGTALMYFFSVRLGVLPMVGDITPARFLVPVITLALPMACRYARMVKAGVLDELGEGYVVALRAKGLHGTQILGRALKNALAPIVNLLGLSFGTLLGGAVVVESIFSWPGLGSYLMFSIGTRDYPVIIAYVLLMAVIFVLINFLVDLLVYALDPRVEKRL